MITREINGLTVVQSELLLSAGLPHGWFGVSLGNTQTRPGNPFNDAPGAVSPEAVNERRARACEALGLDAMRLVTTKGLLQTDRVLLVGGEHAGTQAGLGDGYITNEQGMPIAINAADCLQTFIYDPSARALGVVHSGGMGTSRGILFKTVRYMTDTFDAHPHDMLVGMGPSIAPEHFVPTQEVDGFTLESIAGSDPVRVALEDGRWGYDVRATAARQLQSAGILGRNVEVSEIDTYGSPDFYSWERDREGAPAMSMRRHLALAAIPAA